MRNQHDIDRFTLAFHKRAVTYLRQDGRLLEQAQATLDRWQAQRGITAPDPYFDQWRALLRTGVDAVERAVCVESSKAAALRNMSPLGFVLDPVERMALHWHVKAPDAA